MQLTLTPEITDALIKTAQQQGTTPEILALSCLQRFLGTNALETEKANLQTREESLADFLEGYIGILSSDTDNNGETKRAVSPPPPFTQYLMQKRDQGKL